MAYSVTQKTSCPDTPAVSFGGSGAGSTVAVTAEAGAAAAQSDLWIKLLVIISAIGVLTNLLKKEKRRKED